MFSSQDRQSNFGLLIMRLAAVFFGLIYVGPGRYSIAVKLEKK